MDEETRLYYGVLWGRYFKAVEEYETNDRLAKEYEKKAGASFVRVNVFSKTLAEEGFDPQNPPPEFSDRPPTPEQPPSAEAEETINVEMVTRLTKPVGDNGLFPANGNGSGAPINKTHAIYLLMRKAENRLLSIDELFDMSEEAHYGISREDVGRVVARQVARGFMMKIGGKYKQTPEGEKFDNFIRRGSVAEMLL